MATHLPCGMACRYLDRRPERLVVEGFRRWMAGCERGSIASWELAADFFAEELGPIEGNRMLGELVRWVDTVRLWMDRPAALSPSECPRLCRDECMAVAMIAASQSRDADGAQMAASLLVVPEGREATVRAAACFADALAETGHFLIPVPSEIVREIADRPARQSFH